MGTTIQGGDSGKTVTGGDDDFVLSILSASTRMVLSLPISIAPGGSIAVTAAAPPSNTSIEVAVAAVGYIADLEV